MRFAQGCRKATGGSGGVDVVMEVEMALRYAVKAADGGAGAGDEGGRASALGSSLAVLRLSFSSLSAGIGPHQN